jgi:hypothetical protein
VNKQTKKNKKQTTPKKRALLGRHPTKAQRARVTRARARQRKAPSHYTRSEITKRYDDRIPKARRARAAAERRNIKAPEPCQHPGTRVLETRRPTTTDRRHDINAPMDGINDRIRRRLECLSCHKRFTQYAVAKSTGPSDRWKDRRPALGYRY